MKGSRAGAPPTDLLVCFPSRSHLALTHKPINSPSRPNHRSQSSPLFRAPNKNSRPNRSRTQLGSDIGSEPTSPKVTCAGQIKVRHQHHHKNLAGPRRPGQKNWVEALGIKKDVMNFLGALRSLRLSMQCFGSFSGAVDCCSDEEEEDGEEEEEEVIGGGSQSRSVFSKWLMVLEEENREGTTNGELIEEDKEEEEEIELPPKNALLLMRCRSAPAKGREEEKAEDKEVEEEEEERLMLMSYAPDFFKLSTEIAKETWVVGSADPLVRSRSWRR